MTRQQLAMWIVLISLLIGFLGNLLFYEKAIGISFPLFIVMAVVGVLGMRVAFEEPLCPRNLWPLVPMIFFAIMVAVRASPQISLLNTAATLGLGALTLYYLPLGKEERYIDEESASDHLAGVLEATLNVGIASTPPEIGDAKDWAGKNQPSASGNFGAVLRGLLIALPILLVFMILLGSADAVFGDFVSRFFEMFAFKNFGDLIGQAILTLALAWLVCGGIAYGVARRAKPSKDQADSDYSNLPAWFDGEQQENVSNQDDSLIEVIEAIEDEDEDAPGGDFTPVESSPAEENPAGNTSTGPPFRLGIIEASIVLGSVDLLFGAFVLVQFTYFFGGRANIAVDGLTYAEYARRGFFELVMVSVLVLGMSLVLDWTTTRTKPQHHTIFRALVVALVVFTLVILVAAARRMALYEDVYGFTHLRVYTHVFMLWLGVLLGVFLLSLFKVRKNIFSLGVLLVLIGCLATLNVMNVDFYIADHNIDRYNEGKELDTDYLYWLSADAVPAVASFYATRDLGGVTYRRIGEWLAKQNYNLENLREGTGATFFSAHVGRARAWSALNPIRDSLPAYTSSLYRDW